MQQRRYAEWRDKWHDNRARVISIARVFALTLGLALIVGYLSASGGGEVAAQPAPAALEPVNAAPATDEAPSQLRLRPVSVPQNLRPASRRRQSESSSSSNNNNSSGQSDDSAPSQSEPSTPSRPSGSFDSIG